MSNAVENLLSESGLDLPKAYLDFLLKHEAQGPVEGKLDVDPWWFRVWVAKEVLEANQGYQVEKYAPNYFAFGSNGGGELLAFCKNELTQGKVFMIPALPIDEAYARVVSEDFPAFVKAMKLS